MINYYDVSSVQGQMQLPSDAAAIVAKATEGNYYRDSEYAWFKQQAANRSLPFSGYHFLKEEIDPAVQAQYYHNFAGNVPCMVDVETSGNSHPTVDQTVAFIQALHGLGGHVWGVYFPRWYWSQVTGDLSRLTALGAVIIASNYTNTTMGWQPYGGATPAVLQYTSTPIDTNAFNGTAQELADLINGDNMNPVDVWAWRNVSLDPIDMRQRLVNAEQAAEAANAKADQILAILRNLGTGGSASPQAVADATLAELKAKL
jgi:GH25 family lysozyme M1 (1,4-beta-N-acetylmuramidase)